MPHPEQEHALMIEVARLRRECDALHMRAVGAETRADRNAREVIETLDALSKATDRTVAAQEALAAARRECEAMRNVINGMHETYCFHTCPVGAHEATCMDAAALAAPAAGEEGKR